MAYLTRKDVAASPRYDVVVGKFCYPPPVSFQGRLATDSTSPRPLVVGTDVSITASSGDFRVEDLGDLEGWGINEGDYISFSGTGIDGKYLVKSVALPEIILAGPGQSVSSGYLVVEGKSQKVNGTGTKFKQDLSVGDYLIVMGLSISVQARKIVKIESDTVLYLEEGFIGSVSNKPVIVSKKGLINGVSIKCEGAGVLDEKTVAEDDVLTFFDEEGLKPVYGDSGSNTFKILIQSK